MPSERDAKDEDDGIRILSNQGGAHVYSCDDEIVFKRGSRVQRGEEVALGLVKQHQSAPVREVFMPHQEDGFGSFAMEFVPGFTLTSIWDSFDDKTREKICRETWAMITRWREIPRPEDLIDLYQCPS